MLQCKQSEIKKLSNLRANNSSCSSAITPIIELIPNLMVMYIFTKFGALITVDARVYTKSNIAIFVIQGQITPVVLIPLDR